MVGKPAAVAVGGNPPGRGPNDGPEAIVTGPSSLTRALRGAAGARILPAPTT